MGLTLRFGNAKWQFCVISIVITSFKFHFNLLELDIINKEEPISLLTVIKNRTYTRIEFFKLTKTIKNN